MVDGVVRPIAGVANDSNVCSAIVCWPFVSYQVEAQASRGTFRALVDSCEQLVSLVKEKGVDYVPRWEY